MIDINANYTHIMAQVAQNAKNPDDITVIAACKEQTSISIATAYTAGIRHFGENKQQQLRHNWHNRAILYPDVTTHFIGSIQSNKLASIIKYSDVIHTLDRQKLLDTCIKLRDGQNIQLPRFLVQVNLGREPQKSGITPEHLNDFINQCRNQQLLIDGLMTIPPANEDPTPFFQELKKMATHYNLPHLSMGMSNDYPQAIKCGATMVRIGTALFGRRG